MKMMDKLIVLVILVVFVLFDVSAACTDSDKGKNYFQKGITSDSTGIFTDSCTYCTGAGVSADAWMAACGAVIEYSCASGKVVQNKPFVCENGCMNGICIEATPCHTRYWFDGTNKNCDAKEFCGAYMYAGLNTFDTKAECLSAVPKTCGGIANIQCSNGYYCQLSGSNPDANGICVISKPPVPPCISSGSGRNPSLGPNDPNYGKTCCAGLTELNPTSLYDSACTVQPLAGYSMVCSACGDGVCNSYENNCNCPNDCKSQECSNSGAGCGGASGKKCCTGLTCQRNVADNPNAGVSWTDGICVGSSICTEEYNPVCGVKSGDCAQGQACSSQPQTYSNKCKMEAAGANFIYEGACKPGETCKPICKEIGTRSEGWYNSCTDELINYAACGAVCTEEYVPVCGQISTSSTPVTYSNRCKMESAGAKFLYEGVCKIESSCIDSDEGKDYSQRGITIDNDGMFTDSCTYCTGAGASTCSAVIEYSCVLGKAVQNSPFICDDKCKDGACIKSTVCTEEYMPVCGIPPAPSCPSGAYCAQVVPSPTTYTNRCKMAKAGATYLYDGECRLDSPCVDTDGGKEYSILGTTSDATGIFTDSCTYCTGACTSESENCDSTCGAIIEYTCENNKVKQNDPYTCENGCMNGKCKANKECPSLAPLSPGFCAGGTIIPGGFDSDGCQSPPTCRDCSSEGKTCAGISGIECCDGLICQMDGKHPDATGTCIRKGNECDEICKNIGSRSEGWYDSCTGRLIRYEKCGSVQNEKCDGCTYEGRCLPYGTRRPSTADINSPVYCELNSKFVEQKFDDSNCQNDYECMGNSCISGKCTDLGKEMQETRNMIQRFWDWLRGVF